MSPRPFGRTGELISNVWRERGGGLIDAGGWIAIRIGRDDLDRRGYDTLQQRIADLPRKPDLVIVHDVLANDIKAGWPMHRLQQFRDRGACRYFAVETESPLEAEWIATNVPVHAIVVPYSSSDMSARYRVFDAAQNAGVAVIGRANLKQDAALQLATPQLHATLLSQAVQEPIASLSPEDVQTMWSEYSASHREPEKLRGAHPPDEHG